MRNAERDVGRLNPISAAYVEKNRQSSHSPLTPPALLQSAPDFFLANPHGFGFASSSTAAYPEAFPRLAGGALTP
jgi:hypothetical protein